MGWAGLLYVSSGGNQVDGSPPVAHNAAGKKASLLRAKIFVANGVFERDMLRIYLSDRGHIANAASLGTKEGSYTSPMAVIITSVALN